jgi:hypothetical protein
LISGLSGKPSDTAIHSRFPHFHNPGTLPEGEWFLRAGHRYGIVCNSDGHKGRPGSNGLTAVFSEDLSRDATFTALRARRCYGTTNARILLVFGINAG